MCNLYDNDCREAPTAAIVRGKEARPCCEACAATYDTYSADNDEYDVVDLGAVALAQEVGGDPQDIYEQYLKVKDEGMSYADLMSALIHQRRA